MISTHHAIGDNASAVSRSSSWVSAVIESIPDGVVITRESECLYANSALCRILNCSFDDLVGRPGIDELVPRALSSSPPNAGGLEPGTPTPPIEAMLTRHDGTVVPVEVYSRRIPYEHGDALLSIVRDVSNRKRAEAAGKKLAFELRRAQSLSTQRLLTTGMTHEFNNLLQIIFGYTTLCLLDEPEESPTRAYLEKVQAAAKQGRDLLRPFSRFHRDAAQARTLTYLERIVEQVVRKLEESLLENITVVWKPGKTCRAVFVDTAQIRTAVMQLCSNACDAMRTRGGVLEIRIADQSIASELVLSRSRLPPGDYVQLSVEDTGTGMDPATLDRIFEPFVTTKSGDGAGLGLPVAHGIVEHHGGGMLVESRHGDGSRFDIYLPAAPATRVGGSSKAYPRTEPDRDSNPGTGEDSFLTGAKIL